MGPCCCKDSSDEELRKQSLISSRQRRPTKDTIDDLNDHYFNNEINNNNNNNNRVDNSNNTSPNFMTYSSYEHVQSKNPKLFEDAEKRKRQLEKTLHIFIVSCASELGEEVLRIVYAEMYRAVEQISNDFFQPPQGPQSPNSINPNNNIANSINGSSQLKLIENVLTFLNKIAAAADKDSFVVVEQEFGRGRRTQIDAFGRPQYEGMKSNPNNNNNNSTHNNNEMSSTSPNPNLNKIRGGGGTFGDEITTTTSMPSFFPISESRKKDIKNKFDSQKKGSAKSKGQQDAEDAAALAAFEQEMCDDENNEDDARADEGGNISGKGDSSTKKQKSSRILRIWQDSVSIAQQSQFRPIYDRLELIKMWLLGDKIYSGSLPIETVIKLIETCAHEQKINTELADRLITQIGKMSKRPQNPLTSMNFADLYVMYQEYGFWFPELEQFWENAAAAAKKRTQIAAERLAAENMRKVQEKEFLLKEKFRKARAARKIASRDDDDVPVKFTAAIPAEEELRGSQEFLEALATLPEDVLTKNDLIQFLLFHQKTVSLENTQSGYGGRRSSMARNRGASFSTAKARKQADLILESIGGYCSKEAFLKYLIDPELNNILTDASREKGVITHDMSLPITNYFISSSWKSFLATDKMRNIADLSMFRRILNCGCRCIDLEIWENNNNSNSSTSYPLVVYFNPNPTLGANSPTTASILKLPLNKVLAVINENAFASSSYPLIVHLDIRVYDKNLQEQLSRELVQGFGSALMTPSWHAGDPVPSSLFDLSPEALVNKILLMGKRSLGLLSKRDADRMQSMDARALVNKLHAPAFAGQTFDLKKNQQQAKSGDSAILIPQLGDLIFFDTVGGVVDISKTLPPNVYSYHCTQYEEQVALGFCSRYTTNCIKAGIRQLLNVFPEGSRVACNNFNPQNYWNAGVQICSLFWQDAGLESRVYRKRFMLDNGNCGYLRKPFYMIMTGHNQNNLEEEEDDDDHQQQQQQQQILSPKSRNPIESAFGAAKNSNNEKTGESNNNKKNNSANSPSTGSRPSTSSTSKTPSFHLELEFLSAIQLPVVHAVYNPATGKKSYRALSNPYIRAYIEGPLINNYDKNYSSPSMISNNSNNKREEVRERKQFTQLFPPSMVLGDEEKIAGSQAMSDPHVQEFLNFYQRNLSSGLDSTLRFLSNRQSSRGDSSFAATVKGSKSLNPNNSTANNNINSNNNNNFSSLVVTGEGTHHPIFVDLVQEALSVELKRIQSAKRVYSTSSAAASTNMLANFLEAKKKRDVPYGTGKKNVMVLNVPVPDLSTLVIQIIAEDTGPGGNSNNNNGSANIGGGAGGNSSGASPTASTSTFYNNSGTSSATAFRSPNSASFRASDYDQSEAPGPSSSSSIMNLKNVGFLSRDRANTIDNSKVIIAEAILPVHLLQTGVRCVSLHDVTSYPYLQDMPEARLLVKVSKSKQHFLTKADLLSENAIWTINQTFEEQAMAAAKHQREVEERKREEAATANQNMQKNAKLTKKESALEALVAGGNKDRSNNNNTDLLLDEFELEDTFGDLAQMILSGADKKFEDKEDEDFWASNVNPMLEKMKNETKNSQNQSYQPPSTPSISTSSSPPKENKNSGGHSVVPVPRRRRGDTTIDEFLSNITSQMTKDDDGNDDEGKNPSLKVKSAPSRQPSDVGLLSKNSSSVTYSSSFTSLEQMVLGNTNTTTQTKIPQPANKNKIDTGNNRKKSGRNANDDDLLLLSEDEELNLGLEDSMSDLLADFNKKQPKTTQQVVTRSSIDASTGVAKKKTKDEELYEQALMDFLDESNNNNNNNKALL